MSMRGVGAVSEFGVVRRVRVERRFSAAFAEHQRSAWAAAVIGNDGSGSSLIVWNDLGRQPEGWLYPLYANSETRLWCVRFHNSGPKRILPTE